MDYIKIKGLEKPISKMIFGTAWLGLEQKDIVDEQLSRYIEMGGNLIDTGKYYNGGKTETYLRGWIKEFPELREKVMFTNKGCHYHVDENNIHHPEIPRVSVECIKEDLEFSLSNLGLDHIDIYMLHRDNEEVSVGPLFDTLEKYRLEGKITTYGVSNWSINRIKEAITYCEEKGYQGVAVNSCSYSLCTAARPRWSGTVYATDEYAKQCSDLGVTILSWGSQGGGFFGNYPFPKGKRVDKDFQEAFGNLDNFEKFRRAKELAKQKGVSMTNISYAYIFNQGLDIAGIVGTRTIDELNNSFIGLDLKLTTREVEYLSLRSDTL